MPWCKVGDDDYVSPSGRHWTLAQIRAYLAKNGDKKKAMPLSVVKAGLKAAYRRGIAKGQADERAKLDGLLARFTAMKELNGHTPMFLEEWSETEDKSMLGRGLSKLFGMGKPKQEKPNTGGAKPSHDTTPDASDKTTPDQPKEERNPSKVVADLLGHNSDAEQTSLSNEGKIPDQIADDVYQLAPDASHVDSFRLTSEGDNPAIDVKFKNGGSYRYHFRPDQADMAQTVWEELSAVPHPGIVIWHWLIRGGVPYEKKAWNRFADAVYFEGVILKAFDESKHPRDHGKFASSPGASGSEKVEKVATISDHSADTKARSLMSRIGEVPHLVKEKVTSFVTTKYGNLVSKFGPTGAKLILGACVLMLPVPAPFATFYPIAIANAVHRLLYGGAAGAELVKAMERELTPDEVKAAARELLNEIYAHLGDDPETDDSGTDDADTPIITTGEEDKAKEVHKAVQEESAPEAAPEQTPQPAPEPQEVHKAVKDKARPRDDRGRFISRNTEAPKG